ncbi:MULTISPECIES: hypothetical protein [Candidatus Nitrosocaldus]|uniref:Uncharacterized protein n=1 Tax=Candidatus Nitrosocaldus cavascurensis TaxID=2058097 RepID=A0A2K5ARI9_9ARCH|nr:MULTISPECIES: hypothetical protein [Candidatus Nitrosocaldus]SPC34219.1 protein of unknown function [Candidatus Nitrosocaldus cavascurensis]
MLVLLVLNITVVVMVFFLLLLSYIVITTFTSTPTIFTPTPNTTPTGTTTIGFNNYVVIRYGNDIMVKKNEATDYAKSLLLQALLTNKHDTIRQYIPVVLYNGEEDITDKVGGEYHSLVEVKTFAIAIRLLIIPEEDMNITRLVVKSQQGSDLFTLPVDITVKAYQSLYLIWYIQLAAEGITDNGASLLLSALAYNGYANEHAIARDIVLLSESSNVLSRSEVLPLSTLAFNANVNASTNTSTNTSTNSITFEATLKNNTMKEYKANGVGVRDTNDNIIFIQSIGEEITAKPYDRVNVRITIIA